jgi:hypothetical protein
MIRSTKCLTSSPSLRRGMVDLQSAELGYYSLPGNTVRSDTTLLLSTGNGLGRTPPLLRQNMGTVWASPGIAGHILGFA